MGNLRNCSIFLVLLCTFLISDTFSSPIIHGKKGKGGCYGGRRKHHHKRAVDGQPYIADLPSKMSLDDPQVKLYAQKGIEKLAATSTGPSDPLLQKILDATFYDPAGKLLYAIKIEVGSKTTKDSKQQCTVNVWRESDAEPSVTVECPQARRRRADDVQPQIADLPTQSSVDDPQVKKYAEKGIEKLAETSTGPTDPVLEKILEATFFPPAGKLLYEIKMKVASKKTKDASQECKVNVWRESEAEPSVTVECTQARRRRADDVQPQIADLPTTLSIDDPNVKKYAQVAVDKMGGPLSEMKGILKEIVEAKSYPPSDKLLYTVKLKIGSTKCPKGSNEQNCEYDPEAGDSNCEISVFKKTNGENSTSIECWRIKRRRNADDVQPEIADLPTKLSIDDPEVKKFAQEAADRFGSPRHQDKKAIIKKIGEATSYPPAGKLMYKIKMQLGSTNCTKGSDELNCEHNPEDDYDNCELDVLRNTDAEPTLSMVCSSILRRRRDAVDIPKIPNLPKNVSIDDPEVRKYAQNAVDRFGTPIAEDKKAILREIEQAILYSRDGKDFYMIKMRVGVTNCAKESEEKNCKHNPEEDDVDCELYISTKKENDKELSQVIECMRAAREKREVTESEPQIADLPTTLSIDDPKVKEYAQMAVDKIGGHSSGKKGIVREIVEAKSYPPSGKLLYTVKLRIGSTKCPKESNEKNCEYDPEADVDNCEISVFKETDGEDSTSVECWRIDRRRRASDGLPEIADLPTKSSVDDPQVKKYAEKGIEKLAETSTGPTDPVLEKILEATFFPPAGKLLYEIKMKVASKKTKDASQECKVNVWRESDAEPSVTVECGQARRKRADADDGEESFVPLILDKPLQVSSADPDDSILKKIEEALIANGENKSKLE